MFLPFWTLSQSRKISSPPSTEPHVLSMREIFRLEALGDSAGETGFTFDPICYITDFLLFLRWLIGL